ncbi:MAG: PD40 domain-containing protein [Acidobacteriota bacterium]|nr:MAG: PD40 domain-containing protein [Acidobacteriota bacterium]
MKISVKISVAIALVFTFAASAAAQDAVFFQDVEWSPDGNRLAFSRMRMETVDGKRKMSADIWIAGVDGADRTVIGTPELNEYFVSWSPDGKWIAYGGADPETRNGDVYLAKADGSGTKRLTGGNARNSQPAISPDGERIVFASTRDTEKYQLYVMDSDGNNVKRLTTDDSIAHYNPKWSPDGKRIVFYSEKGDDKDQIWTIAADGSDARLLTKGIGHNIFPGYCPDGRVIFVSNRDGDEGAVYTMKSDGSGIERIDWLKTSWARISPDGKRIAWIEGGFPRSDIYVADLDGGNRRKITGESGDAESKPS